MPVAEVRTDMVLVHTTRTATIHAPIELRSTLLTGLLNLPDAEYQRCAPPDHIAAGIDDDRRRATDVDQRRRGRWQPGGPALRGRGARGPATATWCRSATCRHPWAGPRFT